MREGMMTMMPAPCPSVVELQHELDVVVLEFEGRVAALVAGDGAMQEAFEDWREAFYEALEGEAGGEEAERRLRGILGTCQEPEGKSQEPGNGFCLASPPLARNPLTPMGGVEPTAFSRPSQTAVTARPTIAPPSPPSESGTAAPHDKNASATLDLPALEALPKPDRAGSA